jgi:heme/copper-type cytochrome/quinol oxidase subunit 1
VVLILYILILKANNNKSLVTEIKWLALCILITLLLSIFCLKWNLKHNEIILHFHDTYFVLPALYIIISVFLLFSFLVYFIRLVRNRFNKNTPIVITLIDGLLLIIILAFTMKNLYVDNLAISGWTAYPPLSSLGESNLKFNLDPTVNVLNNILLALQIIVTISLVYTSYKWGKNTFKNKIQS